VLVSLRANIENDTMKTIFYNIALLEWWGRVREGLSWLLELLSKR
jgi:hypothetical protein